MSLEIDETKEAIADAIQVAEYIAKRSDLNASDKFLAAVKRTYRQLADEPGMGVLRDYDNPAYAGMRMWQVSGYRKYLVFYQVVGDELKILRVLHGARDLYGIFAPDDEE